MCAISCYIWPRYIESLWQCVNMFSWCNWSWHTPNWSTYTVYPKKYAHGFVVLCFVVVMQSFIMNSHEVFIHIHQGCFAGTGAIVRLPQCQWSKPDGYGKTSQCITTTKHSKAKTVCIFLGIYCICVIEMWQLIWFEHVLDHTIATTEKLTSVRTISSNIENNRSNNFQRNYKQRRYVCLAYLTRDIQLHRASQWFLPDTRQSAHQLCVSQSILIAYHKFSTKTISM